MSKKKSDKKTQQEIKEALFQLELEKNRERIKDHFQREREALDKRIELVTGLRKRDVTKEE